MRREDFHFELPEQLIAQLPLPVREASRLLCLDRADGSINDRQFTDLPGLLRAGDLLVFNDTRVIPARLHGQKDSGGKIEVLVERVLSPSKLLAHVRASKSPKPDTHLLMEGGIELRVEAREGDLFVLCNCCETPISELLELHGHMPLPPYIQRDDQPADRERYQTVYATSPGAVAAPTAGLHFSAELMQALEDKGVKQGFVTLHVGAGTFQPVRADKLEDHVMHSERVEVSQALCDRVALTREQGGRVIAVGTTAVRSLESAVCHGVLRPFDDETDIFIYPGYQFQVIDGLITNFHLPESTLLMLVAAFAGFDRVMQAYRHAVQQKYRFFSYGDAMLVL